MPSYKFPSRDLRRLSPDFYCGFAWVHWTMTIDDRATGWLTPAFHTEFRLLLLHTCARYSLLCPTYCLMPDHLHLLLLGVSPRSDQRLAIRFLRRHVDALLGEHKLQHQPYEHVLRTEERERDDFENTAAYIRENPVRGKLVEQWTAWPYGGCMLPGYPELNPASDTFWESFWRIYHAQIETAQPARARH
jgi:putative transposase